MYGIFAVNRYLCEYYPAEAKEVLNRDSRSFGGYFVDIRQQSGEKVRMLYAKQHEHIAKWIGINEQMADKFISACMMGLV